MNTQDFIKKIQEGSLSEANKATIVALLTEQGPTFAIKEQIKDIIQASIDADMHEELTDEDKAEINTREKALDQDISAVEGEFAKDMDFVDGELENLKIMMSDLDKVIDEVEIEDIKNKI